MERTDEGSVGVRERKEERDGELIHTPVPIPCTLRSKLTREPKIESWKREGEEVVVAEVAVPAGGPFPSALHI